ncbi:MAG: hypothetical protein ACOCX1_04565 [Fimbriimonadaceae bacterium]
MLTEDVIPELVAGGSAKSSVLYADPLTLLFEVSSGAYLDAGETTGTGEATDANIAKATNGSALLFSTENENVLGDFLWVEVTSTFGVQDNTNAEIDLGVSGWWKARGFVRSWMEGASEGEHSLIERRLESLVEGDAYYEDSDPLKRPLEPVPYGNGFTVKLMRVPGTNVFVGSHPIETLSLESNSFARYVDNTAAAGRVFASGKISSEQDFFAEVKE